MRLPARWFIVVAAVVVAIVAFVANAIVIRVEPVSAGLSATTTGTSLSAPVQPALPGGEHTRSFDVVSRVRANGTVSVQETIVQDFGAVPHHGIERTIPQRDSVGDHPVTHLVVSTSPDTPDNVDLSLSSDVLKVRIGDPNRTITGAHAYRLTYDIGGMTESADGGKTRLAIDAISAWAFTIDSLRYTVIAPAAPTTFTCQQGALGSTARCASKQRIENGAVFTGSGLAPDHAFTVRLTWPDSTVAATATHPALEIADGAYALLAGLAVGIVGWRYRRRWRALLAAAQTQLWATFGPDISGPQAQSYNLTDDPAIEFIPPMGLRPGEAGTLVEANSTTLLTATVVDLAARGAIKITELSGSWTLERRNRDLPVTADEYAVIAGLFGEANVTSLDNRGAEMGTLAGELAESLTDDLEARGLANPGTDAGGLKARMHQGWLLLVGIVAVVLGAFGHAIIVSITGSRAAAVTLEAIFALVVILGVGAMLVRAAARGLTPLGLAAAWRVRGFDRFFTASEAMHDRAAADRGLLRQYMGYAIVFGHVTQWIDAFEATDTSDWFATSSPLNYALIGFTASSLWNPPPSVSSSGFGGGGGGAGGGSGGGGGGSW